MAPQRLRPTATHANAHIHDETANNTRSESLAPTQTSSSYHNNNSGRDATGVTSTTTTTTGHKGKRGGGHHNQSAAGLANGAGGAGAGASSSSATVGGGGNFRDVGGINSSTTAGAGVGLESFPPGSTAAAAATSAAGGGDNGGPGGINWSTMPTPVLHAYRHAHRLPVPSAFSSLHSQLALTNPQGLGRFSPSMAGGVRKGGAGVGTGAGAGGAGRTSRSSRAAAVGAGSAGVSAAAAGVVVGSKGRRRISKDALALAVRKDFNAAAVNETDVVTSFLYSVRNQNKQFRMRFAPTRGK